MVVVPVVGISRLTEESLSTALSMGDRVVAVHVMPGTEADDRQAVSELDRRWQEWRPDVPLVLLEGVDEDGRPSRVLGPAIVTSLAGLADGRERVILLVGEVAPDRWWQAVLFNNRGSVVARYVGRHSTAVVCRFRFRLLPRRPAVDGPPRRDRGLVLPRG